MFPYLTYYMKDGEIERRSRSPLSSPSDTKHQVDNKFASDPDKFSSLDACLIYLNTFPPAVDPVLERHNDQRHPA